MGERNGQAEAINVAIDTAPEFDVGPLSWVHGEIGQALTRGQESLALFRSGAGDVTPLKHAQAHVHQAAGAIQMVGLDAVVPFTDEIERGLARLQTGPPAELPAACDAIDRACRKLTVFLGEVVGGTPLLALKLFPEYEAMQAARGVRAAAPSDLFYPDLSARGPTRAEAESTPAGGLPAHLLRQRRLFQTGLLGWLRGDAKGAAKMQRAVKGIEAVAMPAGLQTFWWTVEALLDAIVARGLEPSFGAKQLAARIDLQIRRVVEGSTKVADRLRREVLYYVAISAPVTPVVAEVQQAFRLPELIPSAEALSADMVRLEPLLRAAREQIGAAKDAWPKFASGRAENLPRLKQAMATAEAHAREIGNDALMTLTGSLAARLDRMPALNMPEAVAMEYATGLLLAESACENYSGLTSEFPKQVDAMLARLDAVQSNRPLSAAMAAPQLDEMSKRAQERVLLSQVVREIRVNLRHIEQVLDTFFRDHGKRAELSTLAKESRQVGGALRMLGLDQANELLMLCQAQIDAYANADTAVSNDDLELLAESLSSLGFYVEAVEQQRPNRDRLIVPLLRKLSGQAPALPADDRAESVEAAVKELRNALPEIAAEVRRAPADAAARADLRAKLADLRDDAELIGDDSLVEQAGAALKELEAGGTTALTAAVDAIAESGAAAPAPAISAETQRLLATDQKKLDAEFLEIYLIEAGEVLDTVGLHRAQLERNPGTPDALRTVRRGFHTLKGSGRMVGLVELGELAFDVEKILNCLLEEDRSVTPSVLSMIGVAERCFRGWVAELSATGQATPDATALHAAIRALEAELPGHRESVLKPAVRAAAPAPTPEPPPVDELALTDVGHQGGTAPLVSPAAEGEGTADEDEGGVIEYAPAASAMLVPPEPALSAGVSTASAAGSDEITVGDVTISASLHRILSDEADVHLATLRIELAAMQFDPHQAPSAAMVRASHTLYGINRTGGFPLLAYTAKALEQCLLGLKQAELPPPPSAQPVLARAIDALAALVARVTACVAFTGDDETEALEVQYALEALRPGTAAGHAPEDAEVLAAREAARDDEGGAGALPEAPDEASGAVAEAAVREAFAAAERADAADRDAGDASERAAVAAAAERDAAAAAERAAAAAAVERQAIAAAEHAAAEREAVAERAAAAEREAVAERMAAAEREAVAARMAAAAEREAVAAAEHAAAAEAAERDAVSAADAETATDAALRLSRPGADPLAGVRDDVDDQVLPIFLEEASELFPQAGEALRGLRRFPADGGNARRLRRTLHTLKGSARMAGAMRLGELTHRMESRLEDGDALAAPGTALFDLLESDLDRVAFVLDALREGRINVPLPSFASPPAAGEAVPGVPAGEVPIIGAAPPGRPADQAETAPEQQVVLPFVSRAPAAVPIAATGEPVEAEPGQRALLRVRADIIDRLVNEAGEVAITRSRIDGELRALKANLLELTISVIRLRAQVREIEIQGESQIQSRMSHLGSAAEGFDPLEFDRYTRFQELTRSLAEGVNDVATVQQSLLKNLDDADAALLAQARYARDIQQQLFSVRTVPFGSLSERLYRILRQMAKELDKRANLEIRGAQVELDRSVLEKLVGPLEHMLRNALDHGIEPRAARAAAGKSETGELALTVRQVGNEIAIALSDDGAGLDLEQIRAKAVAQNRIAADAVPTDAQLIDCIFQPGFSTTTTVTAVSGRGIGMDVVRSEVAALGGRVEVATRRDEGTTFLLYLPLTLAVAQAVLVRAGGRLWALPAPMVEQVQQIKPEALLDLYVTRNLVWQGTSYPFHYLPRLLGDTQHPPETSRHNSVLLLRAGQGLCAVHVDEMIGNQEVVVKNIGPQLARVSGIAGATVLGNGEIVLIINPVQLAQRAGAVPAADPGAPDHVVSASYLPVVRAPTRGPPQILIVDDSLTVRKITGRLLAREGFAVVTAKDGIDALERIDEQIPDVILLDIEMPRMDGFEFTRTIRRDSKYAQIPIIMITSRTAEKHRNLARELGVDLYLGKPFQEEELLRNLREMLALT